MIRCKLLYAALAVVMVLFYILYRGTLSLTLLIFTLLLPVYLWIALNRLRKSIDCSIAHRGMPQKGRIPPWTAIAVSGLLSSRDMSPATSTPAASGLTR